MGKGNLPVLRGEGEREGERDIYTEREREKREIQRATEKETKSMTPGLGEESTLIKSIPG